MHKEKLGIVSLIRDHRKSSETREVVYNCRYTGGHFIPSYILQSVAMTKLELKCPSPCLFVCLFYFFS